MVSRLWLYGFVMAAVLICGCDAEKHTVPLEQKQAKLEKEMVLYERDMVEEGRKLVKLQTSMGDIVIELNEQAAPVTVKNFLDYAEQGHYNGTIFHRVIPNFMIQGGGFTAQMVQKRTRAPIVSEASNGLKNDRGTIAMARMSDPDSATCQFFINHRNNDYLNYDGNANPGYTVFGKTIEGMNVVDAIANVKTTTRMGMDDVPAEPVIIMTATIVPE
jgi:cyclophilin family peptidyl-prolyl cis-trans isomerase